MHSGKGKHCSSSNNNEDKSVEPTVEDIFEKLGGYSWFQILATVIILSPEIPASMLSISPVLIGRSDRVINCKGNCSEEVVGFSNMTWAKGFLQHTSINDEFDLFGDRAWLVDWLTSLQMIGSTVGALFCSFWADRYGRKKMFYSLTTVMGVSGILSGCAVDVTSYAVARLCVGVAIGGMYVHYLLYLMEFLTPSFRTICGCISFWAVGEMFLALIGFLIPQWRILTWIISLPAVVLLISFPWLPESPRFLLCKGRTEEAITVFKQIAKLNKTKEIEVTEIRHLQAFITSHGGTCPSKKSTRTIVSTIFSSSRHCKDLLIFTFAWFTCSIAYYGLSFNTKNLDGNLHLNVFYLGVTDLPGHLSGMLFNNRFGRKTSIKLFLILGTSFFISLATIEQFHLSQEFPGLLIALSLFGRYCISASWAILACFTSESFPTTIRACCMGICAFSGNIGGVLAPYMGLFGLVWASGPYILMSILSIMVVAAATWLDEAAQKPLQDIVVTRRKSLRPIPISTVELVSK